MLLYMAATVYVILLLYSMVLFNCYMLAAEYYAVSIIYGICYRLNVLLLLYAMVKQQLYCI